LFWGPVLGGVRPVGGAKTVGPLSKRLDQFFPGCFLEGVLKEKRCNRGEESVLWGGGPREWSQIRVVFGVLRKGTSARTKKAKRLPESRHCQEGSFLSSVEPGSQKYKRRRKDTSPAKKKKNPANHTKHVLVNDTVQANWLALMKMDFRTTKGAQSQKPERSPGSIREGNQ